MANTLDAIMAKILARGLMVLRERAVMPQFVNSSYSQLAREEGDTIDIPVPSTISVIDVTAANTPPSPTSHSLTKEQISLDQWRQTEPFFLTDQELVEIDRNRHFLPMQLDEAVRALATDVNQKILALYTGIYGYVGTAGTTPFGTSATVTDATNARKILNKQKAPRDPRYGVVDFDAEANMLALAEFSDVEKVGERGPKIEGEIGRKYGLLWAADDDVPTHTAGTLVDNVTVNGAETVGSTTITLATDASGSYSLLVGDIIEIDGDDQTYVVTAATGSVGSSTTGDVSIDPPLQVATSGSEAVSLKATHVVNVAFHRDAFGFANRPLVSSTVDLQLGSRIMSMQDPQTGLVMRLEVSRQHKQTVWELDMLHGESLIRPELAVRIAG